VLPFASKCRFEPYQTISEVYSTIPAVINVRITPGIRPRTEYDQGADMMERHIYSEKSNAAVYIGLGLEICMFTYTTCDRVKEKRKKIKGYHTPFAKYKFCT
jgi:hypothetical protein